MKKRKILFIHNFMPEKRDLEKILGSYPHLDIEKAYNGNEALEKLSFSDNIDIVTIGLGKTSQDYMSFIEKIRILDDKIPIVILFKAHQIHIAMEAIKSGADFLLEVNENIKKTLFITFARAFEIADLRSEKQRLLNEISHKCRELEQIAFQDGHMELPSKIYFDEAIKREWQRAMREMEPVSLILIHIDDYEDLEKKISNMEEKWITNIAWIINQTLKRGGDLAARYKKDIFAAMLPSTDIDGAILVAENIRSNIKMSGFKEPLTISQGIATIVPERNADFTALIYLANNALNTAVKDGGDKIVASPIVI